MSAALSTLLESGNRLDVDAADTTVRVPLTASERLALSRARLRQALLDASTPPGKATNSPARGSALATLDSLKSIPGASVVIEAVSSWWAQHPLRIASMLAADAAKTVVQPIAQRNPLGSVLGALLLGGLIAWSRPWRWIPKRALFAGLSSQLFYKALLHVPVQSWLEVLTSLAQGRRDADQPSARSPPVLPDPG